MYRENLRAPQGETAPPNVRDLSNVECSSEKDVLDSKLELKRLLNAEAEAKQKEAQLDSREVSHVPDKVSARDMGHAESSRDLTKPSNPTEMNIITTAALQPTSHGSASASINNSDTSRDTQQWPVESHKSLTFRLHDCEAALDKLAVSLREAMRSWERFQKYERECLLPDFQNLHAAMERLKGYEKGSEVDHDTVPMPPRYSPRAPEEDVVVKTGPMNEVKTQVTEPGMAITNAPMLEDAAEFLVSDEKTISPKPAVKENLQGAETIPSSAATPTERREGSGSNTLSFTPATSLASSALKMDLNEAAKNMHTKCRRGSEER